MNYIHNYMHVKVTLKMIYLPYIHFLILYKLRYILRYTLFLYMCEIGSVLLNNKDYKSNLYTGYE